MTTWETRFLNYQPPCLPWHFQSDDEQWRCDAREISDDKFVKEEENHFYKNENCPSGACIFGSASKPIFNNAEGVDKHNDSVAWNFHFGDREFRRRAVLAPSCIHMKELEFHEFHKKAGKYDQRNIGKPQPILPAVDCTITDQCDTCKPPCRLCPPCVPCMPPPPPASCCVLYPNAMGEKEWHTIRKCVATPETANDENESCLYERDIKTCDPCALPQIWLGRQYCLPAATMRPGDMDKHSVDKPPDADELPPKFNYKEDQGECNKRETRGPGVYPYPGYVPSAPLTLPGSVPCGYHFNEKQAHVYCTCFGGEDKVVTPNKEYPPAPPCPPKVICPPECPCPSPCTSPCPLPSCGPCGPCGPCGSYIQPYSYPCGPCGPCGSPCGPCGPCGSPCGPCGPCGSPCGPCGPCGSPCGPCGPCGSPCGPCGPCGLAPCPCPS